MSQVVSVEHASAHLVELVSSLKPGFQIILTSGNKPVARIFPIAEPSLPRDGFGACKGLLVINREDDRHLGGFID
jgi:antitoxin (DNA-binding transcriptional repressor) of toxin-antitoxin stability system